MFVARREKFLDSHMVLKALRQTGTLVSEWSKVFCFKICIYNKIPLELPDKIRLFFTVVNEPIFVLLGAVSGKGSSSGFIMWQPAGSPPCGGHWQPGDGPCKLVYGCCDD